MSRGSFVEKILTDESRALVLCASTSIDLCIAKLKTFHSSVEHQLIQELLERYERL